jgi:hypothetical protein
LCFIISAYDQAVNAAKAILTKASGQNVDKAAVEQALQNKLIFYLALHLGISEFVLFVFHH